MKALLSFAGSLVGWAGLTVCLVAGIIRIRGVFHFSGFETMTLFNAGVALLVAGAFVKLEALGWDRPH
jgi:hypothetical protein